MKKNGGSLDSDEVNTKDYVWKWANFSSWEVDEK